MTEQNDSDFSVSLASSKDENETGKCHLYI